MSCGGYETFFPSSLVRTVHDLPRFNRHLESTSSSFNITLAYAEGAVSWPAVAIVLGVVLLLVSLLYLTCCAFRSAPTLQQWYTKRKKPGCGCFPLFLAALLCGGGAGLVFYANQDVDSGINGISSTIMDINSTIVDTETGVVNISRSLQNASGDLSNLAEVWRTASLPDPSLRQQLIDATVTARDQADNAKFQTDSIAITLEGVYDVSTIRTQLNKYDDYRFKGTIGVMCFILLIVLLAFSGIICSSPCMLKLTAFLAIFGLVIGWVASAAFLAITVVGSDLCFSPSKFIHDYVNDESYAPTVRYVLYCGDCPSPYQDDYDQAQVYIYNVSTELAELNAAAVNFSIPDAVALTSQLNRSVNSVKSSLDSIFREEINCTHLNSLYNDLLTSTCGRIIDGTALTLAGGTAVGLFMFFLLLCAQRHWTRLIFNDSYEDDTETSQLLPPSERRGNSASLRSRETAEPRPRSRPPPYRSQVAASQEEPPIETLHQRTHLQTEKPTGSHVDMSPAGEPRKVKEAWM